MGEGNRVGRAGGKRMGGRGEGNLAVESEIPFKDSAAFLPSA
jgi:hypothetical protein